MAAKTPIRTVFDSSNNATGLAEFQSGEFVGISHGGTGLTTLGAAGKVLQSNGTALVFGDKAETGAFVTKADAVASNNAVLAIVNTKVSKAESVASNNAVLALVNDKVSKAESVASNNAIKGLIDKKIAVANATSTFAPKVSPALTGTPKTI